MLPASPSPMTSVAGVAMSAPPDVSPGSLASSIPDSNSATTSSQLPPVTGGGGPSGSGPGAIIGAVVAVVVVLVVGAVVVAASLIAWRVRSKGKKTFTGKQTNRVLHVLAGGCAAHVHTVLFGHTFLSIFC